MPKRNLIVSGTSFLAFSWKIDLSTPLLTFQNCKFLRQSTLQTIFMSDGTETQFVDLFGTTLYTETLMITMVQLSFVAFPSGVLAKLQITRSDRLFNGKKNCSIKSIVNATTSTKLAYVRQSREFCSIKSLNVKKIERLMNLQNCGTSSMAERKQCHFKAHSMSRLISPHT